MLRRFILPQAVKKFELFVFDRTQRVMGLATEGHRLDEYLRIARRALTPRRVRRFGV